MEVLAINGGTPQRLTPFPAWPFFAQDEIDTAASVLASGKVNYWTGGECRAFEEEFASAFGRRYGIALANGTLALELALHALQIGAGDEVVVPSRTFIATASCVVARGAKPVVADIDPVSGNLTAETVMSAITPRTRAIIPVHMAGWPCDMQPLLALAAKHGLHVIEDCSQSHGATYEGRPAGSFGVCAAFSFCQDKIMTTGGEGGMLLTDDEAVWRRAWEYKDHGKSWEAIHHRKHPSGFRWLHESFGTNWRMTEIQAAIGRRQLLKLPNWLAQRRANAYRLAKGLSRLQGLSVPLPGDGIEHAWYKFYAMLDLRSLKNGWDHSKVIDAINAEGVPCMAGSCWEIYREKAFVNAGDIPVVTMPVAESLSKRSLMFMVHPTLGEQEMDDTVAAVGKVIRVARG
jgi:dTDP-4-amino-4,6-dideoxygalactose transaminase